MTLTFLVLCWPQCMTWSEAVYADAIRILKRILYGKLKENKMLELNPAHENVIGEAGFCEVEVAKLHRSSCLFNSMAGEPYHGRVGADDVGMRDTAYRFSAARALHILESIECSAWCRC